MFGGVRRSVESAKATVEAKEADWHNARISLAAEVAKTAKVVKGKAAFIGQALGSVYSSELLEGDRAREKAKDKQAKLFPPGSEEG